MNMSALKQLRDRLKAAETSDDAMPAAAVMPDGGRDGKAGMAVFVDLGRPVLVDAAAGPIEFLVSRGELQTELDHPTSASERFHVVRKYRDAMQGAQVKGLRSADWSSTGGGSTLDTIRAHQIDCLRTLSAVRGSMPRPWLADLLERVVWLDDWLDLWPEWKPTPAERDKAKASRMKTLKALHFALDCAGKALGIVAEEAFRRRWKASTPAPSPAARRRILVSRA